MEFEYPVLAAFLLFFAAVFVLGGSNEKFFTQTRPHTEHLPTTRRSAQKVMDDMSRFDPRFCEEDDVP